MQSHSVRHPQSLELPPDMAPAPEGAAGTRGSLGCDDQLRCDKPLPVVPCSPEFNREETRTYGGVEVRQLAWVAPELLKQKFDVRMGGLYEGLRTFTHKMRNALFIYSRVKRALRWLHKPQKVSVYIDDLPSIKALRRRTANQPTPRPAFKWAVSPKDVYQWEAFQARYGFDIRGTSLEWIERRVKSARKAARTKALRAFKEREGALKPKPTQSTAQFDPADTITRVFEPKPGQFGVIWPAVPVPDVAEAPVTVTADYASERKAKREADPDEAVIGFMFVEDHTTRDGTRNDGLWYMMTGDFDVTERGIVYDPDARVYKPP